MTAPPDLKSVIQTVAATPIPAGYSGWDWFQLTDAEEEIFGIAPRRMPTMVCTWGAYEAFVDMSSGSDWDMQHQATIDAAKATRPDLAAMPYGESGWIDFAVAFSDLTMRDAWNWWMKYNAWQGRNGIMEFKDDS